MAILFISRFKPNAKGLICLHLRRLLPLPSTEAKLVFIYVHHIVNLRYQQGLPDTTVLSKKLFHF